MTPIRLALGMGTVCALLTISGFALAETTQVQVQTTSETPLAVGITDSGSAEAQVVEAQRNGDILTIKLRFKPLVPNKTESIYSQISKDDYENSFYVLAGNKKYLLLTDSNGKPLANPKLTLAITNSPIAGTWHGRFPAPPKEIKEVSLTIPGIETLDAISITDK